MLFKTCLLPFRLQSFAVAVVFGLSVSTQSTSSFFALVTLCDYTGHWFDHIFLVACRDYVHERRRKSKSFLFYHGRLLCLHIWHPRGKQSAHKLCICLLLLLYSLHISSFPLSSAHTHSVSSYSLFLMSILSLELFLANIKMGEIHWKGDSTEKLEYLALAGTGQNHSCKIDADYIPGP